jgi:hypothetical protein
MSTTRLKCNVPRGFDAMQSIPHVGLPAAGTSWFEGGPPAL